MFKNVVIIFGLIASCIAALPVSASAQATDAKRAEKARQVKEKIQKLGTGQSAVVKLKLYNDTEYKGYVSRVNDEDFEVVDTARNPHTVRYADVKSIGGKNMSNGTKIAIGIGIGAGVTLLILVLIWNHITQNN